MRHPSDDGPVVTKLRVFGALFASALVWGACVLDRSGGDVGASGGGDGASTSSSATGGATSSTSAGGSAPDSEDCLNGMDDDNDGAVDCEDSDCNGQVNCVEGLPAAASGYYLIPDNGVCPTGIAPQTSYFCGECKCSPQTGDCTVNVLAYADPFCIDTPTSYGVGNCVGTTAGLTATANPPNNLSCNSSATPNLDVTLCQLPNSATSCKDAMCAPAGKHRVCALVDTAASCGSAQDTGLIYGSEQGCSCSCTKLGEQCADISIDMHATTNNCTNGMPVSGTLDGNCGSVASLFNSIYVNPAVATAQCNAVSVRAEAPQGRLCCVETR